MEVYRDSVIMNLPLTKSFLRLNPADKDSLQAKFNTTYFILKKERPFTDYPDLLNLYTKNGISKLGVSYSTPDGCAYFADSIGKVMRECLKKLIFKANCFSVLSDGSTDSAATEQEKLMFFLSVRVHLYWNISVSKMSRMLMHLAVNQPRRLRSITLALLTITTN